MANAEFHWDTALHRQEIRAIKTILEGTEITLCYVTGKVIK